MYENVKRENILEYNHQVPQSQPSMKGNWFNNNRCLSSVPMYINGIRKSEKLSK